MTLDNKTLVLKHLDLSWNKGEFEKIKDFLSVRFHYKTSFTDEILTTEQYIDFIKVIRNAMPDLSVDIDLIVAEDHHVMAQISFVGAVEKPFYGIPASDKIITFSAVSIFEMADNKIISLESLVDMFKISRQIGHPVTPQIPLSVR